MASPFTPIHYRENPFLTDGHETGFAPTETPLNPEQNPNSITPNVYGNNVPASADVTDMPYGQSPDLVGSPVDPEDVKDSSAAGSILETSGMRANALEFKGVNWADGSGSSESPFGFTSAGFYDLDYDFDGSRAKRLGLDTAQVHAANVFGRNFSRQELQADSEGRKLLSLMERARTGEHQKEGFWAGFKPWKNLSADNPWKIAADIPFIGWMVDAGLSVADTISMSKTMRRMQNGEKVSAHDALMVRRYMFEQELESQRGIGYNVGSLIHSSVPFMFEMMASSAMVATSAKVGLQIGRAIGGAPGMAVGAAVGAVGAFVFGGIGGLGRLLARGSAKQASRFATSRLLNEAAERTIEQGMDRTMMSGVLREASGITGKTARELASEFGDSARRRALVSLARKAGLSGSTEEDLAAAAASYLRTAPKNVVRDFTRARHFETAKAIAESVKGAYAGDMDARLAEYMLVNGDVANTFRSGLRASLEAAFEDASEAVVDRNLGSVAAYFAKKKQVAQGFKNVLEGRAEMSIDDLVEAYINGVATGATYQKAGIDAMTAAPSAAMRKAFESMGGVNGATAINKAISASLGGPGNMAFSKSVAKVMAEDVVKSMRLQYGAGNVFVRNMEQFGRWAADGAANGMLRWDSSLYGGLGTIARSGTALGGKVAALKEALKVSFVEAPLRGAMQYGMQIPLWSAVSTAMGEGPGGFVLRGQLGIQAQALQSGDTDMMRHAQAIAIGSGLVEYISENAGRGFNLFASGILKPGFNKLLPEPTKRLGSYMAKKVEAIFGAENVMKDGNRANLVNAVVAQLKQLNLEKKAGIGQIVRGDVERMIETRSVKGIASLETALSKLGISERQLVTSAIAKANNMGRLRAGILHFTAFRMMENGITPQSFARFLERVGYDGMISEMMEERYGGFFQGLLGLDERPSDEGFRGRLAAAMKGLFPDKEQLLTEALGFAFPSVAQVSLHHVYSRLGQGETAKLRNSFNALNVGRRATPELVLELGSADYVEKLQEHNDKLQTMRDAKFGTVESNRKRITDGASALFERIKAERAKPESDNAFLKDPKLKKFAELETVEEVAAMLAQTADNIVKTSTDSGSMEKNLADGKASVIFGDEGTEAVRNLKRLSDSKYSDSVTEDFYREGGDYSTAVSDIPLPSDYGPASVDDIVNQITAAMPVLSNDETSVEALKSRASDSSRGVRVDQYQGDLVESMCDNMETIADAGMKMMFNTENSDSGSWFRRGLMRLVGVVDALTTGDLSLAAQNPVQWALADAGVPRDMLTTLVHMKELAIRRGARDILMSGKSSDLINYLGGPARERIMPLVEAVNTASTELEALYAVSAPHSRITEAREALKNARDALDMALSDEVDALSEDTDLESYAGFMETFADAGKDYFRQSLRSYAVSYLLARNVMAVSKSDISDAAYRVIAYGRMAEDEKASVSPSSEEFRKTVSAEDLEAAKDRIVTALVKFASDKVVSINQHGRFGSTATMDVAFDYRRAMRYGTEAEVVAAIKAMPAFRGMQAVHDLSCGKSLDPAYFDTMARVAEVDELLEIDPSVDLSPEALSTVMRAMGREHLVLLPSDDVQDMAKRFLRQVRVAVETRLPSRHTDANGNDVTVVYSYEVDSSTGERTVTASFSTDAGPMSVRGATVRECIDGLRTFQISPQMDQLVFSEGFTIASRDATSLAVFALGRENARALFESRLGVNGSVSENMFPPILRRNGADWMYDEDAASRKLAEEFRIAYGTDDSAAAKATRARVLGDSDAAGPRGYEAVAAEYLRNAGAAYGNSDASASLLLNGPCYTMRPSQLHMPGKTFVTSDYYSTGDTEALARSVVGSALRAAARELSGNGSYIRLRGISSAQYRNAREAIVREFRETASELAAQLQATRPELAARIRNVVDMSGVDVPDADNYELLAAITTSTVLFTCDRGLNQEGNGFLYGPELALVADRMRGKKWSGVLMSIVDELFGGAGMFSVNGDGAGLRMLTEAFSPYGTTIAEARGSSILQILDADGSQKKDVSLPVYEISPEGGSVAHSTTSFRRFLDAETVDGLDALKAVTVHDIISFARSGSAELAERLSGLGVTNPTGWVIDHMLQAEQKGGEARPSLQFRGRTPLKTESVGSVPVMKTTSGQAAPRLDGVISDVDALYMARTLMFIDDRALSLDRSRTHSLAAVGNQYAQAFQRDAYDMLISLGMDPINADKVCGMMPSAWDNPTDDTDDIVGELDREELEEARANGESVESWEDRKKARAVLDNRDIMAVGRQLQNIFPSEGRNHTAIMFRVATELPQICDAIEAGNLRPVESAFQTKAGKDLDPLTAGYAEAVGKQTAEARINALRLVGRLFNTLRAPRDGTAAETIAAAGSVWSDADGTDTVLANAVLALRDHGINDLAIALNALRRITDNNSRRSIALTHIGNMSRTDTHHVNVDIDDHGQVQITHDRPGTAGGGQLAATTAVVSHAIVNLMVPRGNRMNTASHVGAVISYLHDLFMPNDKYDPVKGLAASADAAGVPHLAGITHDTILDLLAVTDSQEAAVKGLTKLVERVFSQVIPKGRDGNMYERRIRPVEADGTRAPVTLSLADHESITAFAVAYAERMAAVAGVVEAVFGYGNPLCYALRNPDMVQYVSDSLTRLLTTSEDADAVSATFMSLYNSTVPGSFTSETSGVTYYHNCPLIEDSIVNAMTSAMYYAPSWRNYRSYLEDPDNFEDPGVDESSKRFDRFVVNNNVTVDDMIEVWTSSPLRTIAARYNMSGKYDRAEWVSTRRDGEVFVSAARAQSRLAQVLAQYGESLPRATAKVGGTVSGGYTDNGQAVCVGPSPSQMEMRLTDGMLSRIEIDGEPLKAGFLLNGGRFADGSRLMSVAPGALIAGRLADQEHVSRLVFFANHDDYVVRGDVRHMRFELFHGEKPTVNSVQIPGYVCQKILEDIRSGADYTVNEVSKAILSDTGLPESIETADPVQREAVYDAIFSVVAAQAGCAEIDTKRVQVLLSQGAPFTGYRDRRLNPDTCKLEDVAVTTFDGSKKVVPGVVTTIIMSGRDSTQNMGGYLVHGHLSNMHRSLSSGGEDTISEKEHLNDPAGVGLFKGQGHDLNLGIDDADPVPTDGMTRNAQRLLRRSLEDTLGIPGKLLDRPTAEQRADKEYMANRERAVACAKAYLDVATVMFTDMETIKAGPMSTRCGFRAPSEDSPVHVSFKGHDVTIRFTKDDGVKATVDGTERVISGFPMPEYKNKAYSVVTMIPVLMEATGETEVTASDYASIEGEFSRADFSSTGRTSLAESGVFADLGTGADGETSDSLAFLKENDGYVCRYFSRRFVGQIMANSHDESHTTSHNAASNYVRDVIANYSRLKGSVRATLTEPAAITVVSRFLPMAVVRTNPNVIERQIHDSEDLGPQSEANPNSEFVKRQEYLRRKAAIAKLLKPQITANHAVLCSAGAKAELDLDKNSADISWTAGADDYDRDALRPVHVFSTNAAKAFGANRSYCSGFVNFSERSDTFRYGWHVDEEALAAAAGKIDAYLQNKEVKAVYDDCLARMNLSIEVTDKETGAVRKTDGRDNVSVARLAAIIFAYRKFGADSDAGAALRELFGKIFTDYTGHHVGEHDGGITETTDFSDLFLPDGRFDLAAFECNAWRKASHSMENGELSVTKDSDGNTLRTIYLGGSFFIGDRRPSGNFESAGGLARAQAPVFMDKDGRPGSTAMYILDPVTGTTQGSDTDGDSTTCSRLSRNPELVEKARRLVDEVMARLKAKAMIGVNNNEEDDVSFEEQFERLGLFSQRGDGSLRDILLDLVKEFPEFLTLREGTTRVNLTREFSYAMGDLFVNAQVNNYRLMECVRQSAGEDGKFSTGAQEVDALGGDGPDRYVADIGFAGRSPVGPDAVDKKKVPESDVTTRNIYKSVTGSDLPRDMTYAKAFKKCIDSITKGVLPEVGPSTMLRARPSSALSSYAADAGGARGVGVSLQAAVEHMKGYAFGDGAQSIRRLAPALFRADDSESPGYRACEDFIGHFDGICNALFDVVKDLFAPRAGWQKSMLNYLMAKLLYDAAVEYLPKKEGTDEPDFDAKTGFNVNARFDNAWFFSRLVEFAREFHGKDTTGDRTNIVKLLGKVHAGNNYRATEFYGNVREELTFRGLATEAMRGNSVLAALASAVAAARTEDAEDDDDDGYVSSEPATKVDEFSSSVLAPENALVFDDVFGDWLASVMSVYPRKPSKPASAGEQYKRAWRRYMKAIATITNLSRVNSDLSDLLDTFADDAGGDRNAAAEEFLRRLNEFYGRGLDNTAISCSVLFKSFGNFVVASDKAAYARNAIRRLNSLLETEDALSPDSVFQQGGSKALKSVDKADRSLFDEDAAIRQAGYRVNAMVNAARARDIVASAHDPELFVRQLRGTRKGLSATLRYVPGQTTENTAERLRKFLKDSGVTEGVASQDELIHLASLYLREAPVMSDADIDDNRRVLSHLIGAIRLGVESSMDVAGDIDAAGDRFSQLMMFFSEHVSDGQTRFEETLAGLVKGAVTGDYQVTDEDGAEYNMMLADADVQLLFCMLRVSDGRVTLASKSGARDALALASAFDSLKEDRSVLMTIDTDDGPMDIRVKDFAAVLRVMICSTSPFDSVQESDLRADPTSLFLNENRVTEAWGESVMKTLTGRALTRVAKFNDAYDLFADNFRDTDENSPSYGELVPLSDGEARSVNARFGTTFGVLASASGVPGITVPGKYKGRNIAVFAPAVMEQITNAVPLTIIIDAVSKDTSVSRVAGSAAQGKPLDTIMQRTVADFYKTGLEWDMEVSKEKYKDDKGKEKTRTVYTPKSFGFGLAPRTTSEFRFTDFAGNEYDFFEDALNADLEDAFKAGFSELKQLNVGRRQLQRMNLHMALGIRGGKENGEKLSRERFSELDRFLTVPNAPEYSRNDTTRSRSTWAWYCAHLIDSMVSVDRISDSRYELDRTTAEYNGEEAPDRTAPAYKASYNMYSVFVRAGMVFKRLVDANSGTPEGQRKLIKFFRSVLSSGGPLQVDNRDEDRPGQNPVWRKIRAAAATHLARLEKAASQNGGNARTSIGRRSSVPVVSALPKFISRRDAFQEVLRRSRSVKPGSKEAKALSGLYANPEANIRAALEKVFGKWDAETGVKVERVRRVQRRTDEWEGPDVASGTGLLKVTRKFKDANGIHTAVTYISTGEHLGVDMRNQAAVDGLVELLASPGNLGERYSKDEIRTMLSELGADRLNALAHVLDVGPLGLSHSGSDSLKGVLTTDMLLTLTGMVQLSDDARFFTLFHEYYHQMISFYKINGICTKQDLDTLDAAFDSEEQAADAFAFYVTETDGGELGQKLLASGMGGDVDKIFSKFRRTAEAFLSGSIVIDANGVPAFMKMMISGDFTNHSTALTSSFENDKYRTDHNLFVVEEMLLNNRISVPYGRFISGSADGIDSRAGVLSSYQALVDGTGSLAELEDALQECIENDRIPVFPASENPFGIEIPKDAETGEVTSPEREIDRMVKIISDVTKPMTARVAAILHVALARVGGDPGYEEIRRDMRLIGTTIIGGARDAFVTERTVDIAAKLIGDIMRSLSPDSGFAEDKVFNSDIVTELALRLVHRLGDEGMIRPDGTVDLESRYKLSSAAAVAELVSGSDGRAAMPVLGRPEGKDRKGNKREATGQIAAILGMKNIFLPGSNPNVVARTTARIRTDLPRILFGIAEGRDLSQVLPTEIAKGADTLNERRLARTIAGRIISYLSRDVEVPVDGFKDDPFFGDISEGGLDPSFVAMVESAVMTAFAARDYRMDADEQEAEDEEPLTPEGTVPDVTPQLILMTPSSWLASDLLKRFNGVNLSDVMSDTSLQAITEETNRVASHLEFYFGLDLGIGDRARVISTKMSRLGFGEDDLPQVSDKHGHLVYDTAAVRGYMLGLVNFDARRTGDAFLSRDVDLADWAMQAAGAMACGDKVVLTGFDFAASTARMLIDTCYDADAGTDVGLEAMLQGRYDPASVINRVANHTKGTALDEDRPTNFDIALYRIITRLPEDITGVHFEDGSTESSVDQDGMYARILEIALEIYGKDRGTGDDYKDDYTLHNDFISRLTEEGYAITSEVDGKSVLTVPTSYISEVWNHSDTVKKLVKAGRKKTLLDLGYAAELIASDAARLHNAACKSKYLTDGFGQALSPVTRPGLWFEAGTGHYAIMGSKYSNAYELFDGKVDIGSTIPAKYRGFISTVVAHTRRMSSKTEGLDGETTYHTTVRGYAYAFAAADSETDSEGVERTTLVSDRQLAHLMKLMRQGSARPTQSEIREFEAKIRDGELKNLGLDPDMSVYEFDQFMYKKNCEALLEEALDRGPDGKKRGTILSLPEDQGGFGFGRQDFVNIQAILAKTGAELSANQELDTKLAGRINTITETDMFKKFGQLGASKTGTARLRSMAESIVHAERFRGCLVQMLTTVSPNGMPNYIVSPTDAASNFVPDEVWGAMAKFVINRMSYANEDVAISYDDSMSGIENMQAVAEAAKKMVEKDLKNADSKRRRTFNYSGLPPDEIGASGLLNAIYTLNDDPDFDSDLRDRIVGGAAAGHLKQLFGTLKAPTVWAGWKNLDRLMSYSKASSVGLSAFFAIATRIESPIAAAGLWNTLMGQTEKTAELARRLANSKVGEFLKLSKDMPYAADYAALMTSNDPALYHMREILDLLGMPMSSAINNPVLDRQGAIDSDIANMSKWLIATGHTKVAKELRDMARMALHNPGEYAFSHILNSVKMAVVSQVMYKLREECEAGNRPFDPIRELRKYSSYINAEIGGIQAEKYAWLTPTMQQVLRLSMFSYQWTMGAWVAGSGEIVSDLIFGGHHTTPAQRRNTFIRWLRMLGIVQIGIPCVLQAFIKGFATVLVKAGLVGDPDDPDDKDPLGVENMPWLCFDNESKIGMMSFDITPLLKLSGRIGKWVDKVEDSAFGAGSHVAVNSFMPIITGVVGAAAGYGLTRNVGGSLVGLWAGTKAGDLLPSYSETGTSTNRTGRKRFYMHFGKQGAEFFKWFYDAQGQAMSKLSVPTQKVMEAFFGSGNGFEKPFHDMDITDRFFNTRFDADHNALANFFTAFVPFSFNSLASKPEAGILGLFAPLQSGTSITRTQKRIVKRLEEFARDDTVRDVWASPRNRKNLQLLCKDILNEAELNGVPAQDVLDSALATALHNLYVDLFDALPKSKDGEVDAHKATECLRGMFRLNGKLQSLNQSLAKHYAQANVDWENVKNKELKRTVRQYIRSVAYDDPWMSDSTVNDYFDEFFGSPGQPAVRSTDVQQDAKGGENFSNFLATDEVPETLFGIPVVSEEGQYTEDDLAFFKANPKAGGYYDMGEE